MDDAYQLKEYLVVNKHHEMCGGDEWRAVVRDRILPWAIGELDLGDDVLEVGPGYGATTDVLAAKVSKLTSIEVDPNLVAMLTERFDGNDAVVITLGDATALPLPDGRFSSAASFTMLHHVPTSALQDRLFSEVFRVLRSRAPFVAGDSLATAELEGMHVDDVYNPVDPEGLAGRLEVAGFAEVSVRTNPFGWAAIAWKP